MELVHLALGIALINISVFAAGCALAIARTREANRRDDRRRQPQVGSIGTPQRESATR